MSLKPFEIFIGVQILSTIITTIVLNRNLSTTERAYELRVFNTYLYESVRRSTFFVRNYVVTGTWWHKTTHVKHGNIRAGLLPWSDLTLDTIGIFLGNIRLSVSKVYNKYDVIVPTPTLELLDTIRWYNIVAVNWVDGYIDKDDEAFSKFTSNVDEPFFQFPHKLETETEKNLYKEKAFELLFSKRYIDLYNNLRVDILEDNVIVETNKTTSMIKGRNVYTISMLIQLVISIIVNKYGISYQDIGTL